MGLSFAFPHHLLNNNNNNKKLFNAVLCYIGLTTDEKFLRQNYLADIDIAISETNRKKERERKKYGLEKNSSENISQNG